MIPDVFVALFCYRTLKLEKERNQRELDTQVRLMELENQRRKEERDHEFRLFSMFMGNGGMQLPSASGSFVQYNQLHSSAGFNRPSHVNPFVYTNPPVSSSTCTSSPLTSFTVSSTSSAEQTEPFDYIKL